MKRIGLILLFCPMLSFAQVRMDNVDSLLSVMTNKEKATLLIGRGWGSLFLGIGMPATGHHPVPGAAGETRAIERLGIPSLILSDGPAGVRIKSKSATMFPTGISLSSTWDTVLVEQVGYQMGLEARELGVNVLLGPGMGLMRNPLCGRNYEYFSENPDHSAEIARAMTRGLQSAGCGATLKHYALNCQETSRMSNNVVVDDSTMRNVYLNNFHQVLPADPWCIMSSYNKVNGLHVQRSGLLLDTILRREQGYDGVVMTDWMFYDHICDRIMAGNDLIMPGMDEYIGRVTRGLKYGWITQQRLDEAAGRMLVLIARATNLPPVPANPERKQEAKQLVRLAGAKGCVLLKNEQAALPLAEAQTIALFGANAYQTLGGGTGSGFVNCDSIIPVSSGLQTLGYSLLPSLAAEYTEYMRHKKNYIGVSGMSIVSNAMGRSALREKEMSASMVAQRADSADVAVVVLARQAGEGHDRSLSDDWHIQSVEIDLIRNVSTYFHSRGKKVIVVLNISGPIEAESWCDLPDAILCCWCAGQQVGLSVADVLSGAVVPQGRLPLSWPRRWEDLPSSANFPLANADEKGLINKDTKRNSSRKTTLFAEKDNLGYNFYQRQSAVTPLWPFGFGLTY